MSNDFNWNFEKLPFVWSELVRPANGEDLPDTLPFELFVDELNGVLSQRYQKEVGDYVNRAYSKGSVIAGVMDEKTADASYTNDFIDFFKECVNNLPVSSLKILEIGSGTGFLLSEIKKIGVSEVIGIEPGEHCLNAKKCYGVEVIKDFFPSDQITGQFDIIVMSGVLEHIPNPSVFLKSLYPYLKENGQLIISIPDEEPFIASGDISTLFHEHYSFFTNNSIDNCLLCGGFSPIKGRFGRHGGVLLRSAVKDKAMQISKAEIEKNIVQAFDYKKKAEYYNKKLKEFLSEYYNKEKTLGIYVPSRFVNFLSIVDTRIPAIRFFDDNPSIKGKFYPGFNYPIENMDDLIKNPTDVVLVFSKAFGKKIKDKIKLQLSDYIQITTWSELFEKEC